MEGEFIVTRHTPYKRTLSMWWSPDTGDQRPDRRTNWTRYRELAQPLGLEEAKRAVVEALQERIGFVVMWLRSKDDMEPIEVYTNPPKGNEQYESPWNPPGRHKYKGSQPRPDLEQGQDS